MAKYEIKETVVKALNSSIERYKIKEDEVGLFILTETLKLYKEGKGLHLRIITDYHKLKKIDPILKELITAITNSDEELSSVSNEEFKEYTLPIISFIDKLKTLPNIKDEYKEALNLINSAQEKLFKIKQEELRIKEQELLKKEEELKKREKEVGKKGGKYKRSAHLTDQILKYNYPKDRQPSLFDKLQSDTLKDIEEAGVQVSEIVEGIKLSPSETKVIDCLCKLLHETSQNSDAKKEDYYSGNIGYELVEYGGDKNTPAPKLAFTLYELTREYKGGEAISGKDVENIKQILTELDSKRFLLSYVETTRKKDGGRIERKIEDFKKLIHIVKISQTEYSKEDIELSKKEETVILLNPIFRRQINSKFILYPNDINRRTIIAYGSHNLSDIALRLRDYLIREISSKRYQPEINLDKLYYLLAERWMRESRKKKVKEYTEKALETVKALGLLISYEIKTASTGEPKVVFTLNKDWE
jgi:hypothetical protein